MTDKQIILSLTRELEAATKPKWISVHDMEPSFGDFAWAIDSEGNQFTARYCGKYWDAVLPKYTEMFADVTHCQPLPPAPEVK